MFNSLKKDYILMLEKTIKIKNEKINKIEKFLNDFKSELTMSQLRKWKLEELKLVQQQIKTIPVWKKIIHTLSFKTFFKDSIASKYKQMKKLETQTDEELKLNIDKYNNNFDETEKVTFNKKLTKVTFNEEVTIKIFNTNLYQNNESEELASTATNTALTL